MKNPVSLQPNIYYHIYNRGNNREDIFKEERNYDYFQQLWKKYIVPMADTYAYCLLPNHFHALVRIKEIEESLPQPYPTTLTGSPSKQFSNLFNAYAKAINAAYDRTARYFRDHSDALLSPIQNTCFILLPIFIRIRKNIA